MDEFIVEYFTKEYTLEMKYRELDYLGTKVNFEKELKFRLKHIIV